MKEVDAIELYEIKNELDELKETMQILWSSL